MVNTIQVTDQPVLNHIQGLLKEEHRFYEQGERVGDPVDVLRVPRINAIAALYWELHTHRDDVEKVFSPTAVTGSGSSS